MAKGKRMARTKKIAKGKKLEKKQTLDGLVSAVSNPPSMGIVLGSLAKPRS
jgi:hypothetical protein